MCSKCLSVGRFTSGAIPKCSKNLKLSKILTGSAFSCALSCVSLYSLHVGPVSALRNSCMCLKLLPVGRFTSGAILKCDKNIRLAKIVTGSVFS